VILLDGKKVAESVYQKVLLDISLLPQVPKISFVMVGDNPASATYVRSKAKRCSALGIQSETVPFPTDVDETTVVSRIHSLNKAKDVHGILVQLPLPPHLSRERVLSQIHPLKDVDALTTENAGLLFQGTPRFVPCTPAGIMEILKFYQIGLSGLKALVLGRSEIVGKPLAQLLLQCNATVTCAHSKTRGLDEECTRSDIVVVAIGKPKFVGPQMIKQGAVVIDVGINRVEENIVGDVDFVNVKDKVSAITPVPGGVGPMTIAMLMKNLLLAASLQLK